MSFADWLNIKLEERKWSQTELARRTGIAQGQISKIITGNRNAGPEICIEIAQALGISREEIFQARGWLLSKAETDLRLQLSSEATQVAARIDQLPLEQQSVVLQVTETLIKALDKQLIVRSPLHRKQTRE